VAVRYVKRELRIGNICGCGSDGDCNSFPVQMIEDAAAEIEGERALKTGYVAQERSLEEW
jgi:hypothetical protein